MQVHKIKCKSILCPSKISGCDWSLNPYLGCSHGCLYCYASFMTRWHHPKEKWGSFVDVKINAPEILEKQLKKIKKGNICLSLVCDPYQTHEKKFQITRKCLEKLLIFKGKIDILTKSNLVLRDLDLLKKIPNLEVGMSLNCLDDEVALLFEPKATLPNLRIKTLKLLGQNQIKTYAFLGPIIPYFHDSQRQLQTLFEKINEAQVKFVYIDRMNYLKSFVGKSLHETILRFDQNCQKAFQYAATPEYGDVLRFKVKSILSRGHFHFNYKILF